jgi:hypothetical protein
LGGEEGHGRRFSKDELRERVRCFELIQAADLSDGALRKAHEQAAAFAHLVDGVLLAANNKDFDQRTADATQLEIALEVQRGEVVSSLHGGALSPAKIKGKKERAVQERRVLGALLSHLGLSPSLLETFSASDGNWAAEVYRRLEEMTPPAFQKVYRFDTDPTEDEYAVLASHNKKMLGLDDRSSRLGVLLEPYRNRGRVAMGVMASFRKLVVDPIQHCVGFAVPSEAALSAIARCGPVVEVGAGTGYWTAVLRHQRWNVDVVAFDAEPPSALHNNGFFDACFTEVLQADCTTVFDDGKAGAELAHQRALLVVWPNNPDRVDNPHLDSSPGDYIPPVWDADCLASYLKAGGSTVLYVGEREETIELVAGAPPESGLSSSRRFQQRLRESFELVEVFTSPGWGHVTDDLTVWTRKV